MILEINVLLRSIKCLGLKQGIKYYKLYRNAKKNPELILNWIRKCNDTANFIKDDNPELSNIFRDWAALLRKHYLKYKRNETTRR